jgi:hypothetical protein
VIAWSALRCSPRDHGSGMAASGRQHAGRPSNRVDRSSGPIQPRGLWIGPAPSLPTHQSGCRCRARPRALSASCRMWAATLPLLSWRT